MGQLISSTLQAAIDNYLSYLDIHFPRDSSYNELPYLGLISLFDFVIFFFQIIIECAFLVQRGL